MKATVLNPFYDLHHPENTYFEGDTFEGDAKRIAELAKKGFVEELEVSDSPSEDGSPETNKDDGEDASASVSAAPRRRSPRKTTKASK